MSADLYILLIRIVNVTSIQIISHLQFGMRLLTKLRIIPLLVMRYDIGSVTRTSWNCKKQPFLYLFISTLPNERKIDNNLVLSISRHFHSIFEIWTSVIRSSTNTTHQRSQESSLNVTSGQPKPSCLELFRRQQIWRNTTFQVPLGHHFKQRKYHGQYHLYPVAFQLRFLDTIKNPSSRKSWYPSHNGHRWTSSLIQIYNRSFLEISTITSFKWL